MCPHESPSSFDKLRTPRTTFFQQSERMFETQRFQYFCHGKTPVFPTPFPGSTPIGHTRKTKTAYIRGFFCVPMRSRTSVSAFGGLRLIR